MNKNILATLFLVAFCLSSLFSQNLTTNIKYQAEAASYISTSQKTPFWHRTNRYGIVPFSPPVLSLRANARKEYDSTENENSEIKKFGYGYALGSIVNIGNQSQVLIPEAYIKIRYRAFEFYIGRRREIMGLVDTTLSSGSYIWSGNALPMPKVQISVPNYTSVLGHGLLSLKGNFAHGWFGTQTNVENHFLHQKSLYGRIGKPHWKFNFYSGFNHQVQWFCHRFTVNFEQRRQSS